MDTDCFWELIEECRGRARGRDERLSRLRAELSRRAPAEIVGFQVRLEEATGEAFSWELWAAADRIFGGWCSDDGFCYFGRWMVGLGRDSFCRAVADPDALAGTPEVRRLAGRPREAWGEDWPEWESLDYVALEAYGARTGSGDGCGDAFYEAVEAEHGGARGGLAPRGERWDVRSEQEAARRLPRLSAMFPVRSLA